MALFDFAYLARKTIKAGGSIIGKTAEGALSEPHTWSRQDLFVALHVVVYHWGEDGFLDEKLSVFSVLHLM